MKLACLLLLILTGCATLEQPLSAIPAHTSDARAPNQATGKAVICVLQPADASYFGDLSRGSGNHIAGIIRSSLRKTNQPSLQISQLDSNAHALCAERGANVFLKTDILHYEDRANGLFGKPDRVELRLSLYTLDDLDYRPSVIYEAQTNLLRSALLEWRNNKPTNLLGKDFEMAIWGLLEKMPVTPKHADSFGLN